LQLLPDFSRDERLTQVTRRFNSYIDSVGATRSSYHFAQPFKSVLDATTIIGQRGFSLEWITLYADPEFRAGDPIAAHVMKVGTPMSWRRALEGCTLTERQTQFMAKFRELKVGEGLAMPLIGPNGYNALGTLTLARPIRSGDEDLLFKMKDAAQRSHERIVQLVVAREQEKVQLSQRERTVLRHVALGRTNRQISETLAISAASVDTYIRRIFSKLGTSDRVSASLRGVSLGLITL
jgi:DNA-binding CsgD family transcriptional regulator